MGTAISNSAPEKDSSLQAQVEDIEELSEDILSELHPQLVDVIKTIQAEKLGDEAIAWRDFSQHSKD